MAENALVTTNGNGALGFSLPSDSEWAIMERQADVLVKSGFLPKAINTPQKAVAVMLKGRELNLPAWTALTKIHIIEGQPTIAPELMLALIKRSGLMEDIEIDDPKTIAENNACTVTMKRKGETPYTTTFTFKHAQAQGLTGKYNWKKMPHIMLKWRAVSDCARTVFPDVVSGLYLHEEINPDTPVDEMGNITAATPEPEPPFDGPYIEGETVEEEERPEPEPRKRKKPTSTKDVPNEDVAAAVEKTRKEVIAERNGGGETTFAINGTKKLADFDGNDWNYFYRTLPGEKTNTNHRNHFINRIIGRFGEGWQNDPKVMDFTLAEFIEIISIPSDEYGAPEEVAA